ncbi:hypothetical protein X759_28435 [Mesorhizobium sp. LSHC420B00]|nr:hypothetical protein X759_28435 [Mesorhizobium sp. LSHC420B00]
MSKIWFITGANRGFGRIWTEAALARGDKVVATSRRPDALQDLVENYGDAILPLELDVTDRNRAIAAVVEALDAFGRLDVVSTTPVTACLALSRKCLTSRSETRWKSTSLVS